MVLLIPLQLGRHSHVCEKYGHWKDDDDDDDDDDNNNNNNNNNNTGFGKSILQVTLLADFDLLNLEKNT
jgi:hypothetical protein